MQAVIMAGGLGSRLGVLTVNRPKALLPFGRGTLLSELIGSLVRHGVREVVISVGAPRLQDLFKRSLGDSFDALPVRYVTEDKPLGTVGVLRSIDRLELNFLVVNCDIVTDLSFSSLFRAHLDSGAAATAATGEWVEQLRYGTVNASAEGKIKSLDEKPEIKKEILLGAYVLNRNASMDILPRSLEPFDMPDLLNGLIAKGHEVRRFQSDAPWLDVGTREDYEKALSQS
jgi:NDP-sugar pyrophosphorylase family protein